MAVTFYFRIDGAMENSDFFEAVSRDANCSYAGVDFRVGRGKWIPDVVRVIAEADRRFSFTMIELEATEYAALVSCRKYLPERSTTIVEEFLGYLDRIVQQCAATADPRKPHFVKLREQLLSAEKVTVTTAGALRTSAALVEELPLIDQPSQAAPVPYRPQTEITRQQTFVGILRLSQQQRQVLSRSILVLDAVIRGRDHSTAKFRLWRSGRHQPMKHLVSKRHDEFLHLHAFICDADNSGATVNFDAVLQDLLAFWRDETQRSHDLESVRRLVTSFFPIANSIKAHEKMDVVFESARAHISQSTWMAEIEAVPPLQGLPLN